LQAHQGSEKGRHWQQWRREKPAQGLARTPSRASVGVPQTRREQDAGATKGVTKSVAGGIEILND
jgi:hypothetical protein